MSLIRSLLIAGTAAVALAAVPLVINTPKAFYVGEYSVISWTGGQPPFTVSLLPAGQVAPPPVKTFPPTEAQYVGWQVDLQYNTTVVIEVEDADGAINYSGTVPVEFGSLF